MVIMLRFWSSGLWNPVVSQIHTNILEEAPASIFKVEESQAGKMVHDMRKSVEGQAVSEPMATIGPTKR
jgi:hypothetical protein